MLKNDKKFLHWSNYLVSIIGLVYFFYMKFMGVQDELGHQPHAMVAHLQYLHILSYPILIFAIGLIFKSHIMVKINNNELFNWMSGYFLIAVFLPMVFTGILLQTNWITNRQIYSNVHIFLSIVWVIAYGIHHFRAAQKPTK